MRKRFVRNDKEHGGPTDVHVRVENSADRSETEFSLCSGRKIEIQLDISPAVDRSCELHWGFSRFRVNLRRVTLNDSNVRDILLL